MPRTEQAYSPAQSPSYSGSRSVSPSPSPSPSSPTPPSPARQPPPVRRPPPQSRIAIASPVKQASSLSPEDQISQIYSSIGNLEQCCRDQELLGRINNLQQLVNVIARSIVVTTVPVNFDGAVTYIPLASEFDLNQFGEPSRVFPLGPEYLNMLSTQAQAGMVLASGFSNAPLHQLRPNHSLYVIEFPEGRRVVTYGQIVGSGTLIFQ